MNVKEVMKEYRIATGKHLAQVPVGRYLSVIVDYNDSIEFLARGYDFVDSQLTEENFPTNGKGIKEIKMDLLSPPVDISGAIVSTNRIYTRLLAAGYRPATVKEALAMERILVLQKYPVVIIGSCYQDLERGWQVPVISYLDFSGEVSRSVDLTSLDLDFLRYTGRFTVPVVVA